jgi:hypothetical protein
MCQRQSLHWPPQVQSLNFVGRQAACGTAHKSGLSGEGGSSFEVESEASLSALPALFNMTQASPIRVVKRTLLFLQESSSSNLVTCNRQVKREQPQESGIFQKSPQG